MQKSYRFVLLMMLCTTAAMHAMQLNLQLGELEKALTAATKLTESATTFNKNANVERIVDKIISITPSEPTLTKWVVRTGTITCAVTSCTLAHRALQNAADRHTAGENEKTKLFWTACIQGIFSALCAGVALYLSYYKWNVHLSMLPPVILPPVIS